MSCQPHRFLEVMRQSLTQESDVVHCVCEVCCDAFEVTVPAGESVGEKLEFIWPIEEALRVRNEQERRLD